RLQQVALRLRHQERRRQPDVVAALLVFVALLRQRRAGARRLDTLGRALHLPARAAHRFGGIEPQAGDPPGGLAALDFGAREARLFVAPADRIAHRHADAPGWIVSPERLPERRAEAAIERPDDDAREVSRAHELAPRESVPAVRRLEPHVRER